MTPFRILQKLQTILGQQLVIGGRECTPEETMESPKMATVKTPGWKNSKTAKQRSSSHAISRNTKMNIQVGQKKKTHYM